MYLLNTCDFRHFFTDVALDTHVQSHLARRAPDASPVETDAGDAFLGDLDQLDIAAIGLNRGADTADDVSHALIDAGLGGRGGRSGGSWCRRGLTHEIIISSHRVPRQAALINNEG